MRRTKDTPRRHRRELIGRFLFLRGTAKSKSEWALTVTYVLIRIYAPIIDKDCAVYAWACKKYILETIV